MRNLNAPFVSLLLLAMTVALPSGPAEAGKKFYKWQDEQGVWHYDETKPKDRESAAINVTQRGSANDSDPAASTPASTQPAPTPATEPVPTDIAESDEDAESKVIANRQAACEKATTAVSMYENYARVTVDTDNDGVQEPLNTQQQLERLKEARAAVKEYCN
ncbi:hypothetical protein C7S18_19015 [Ahniella affigens]|uniref:DUF4124 domain-containing protein n=1 Tax=Ahniella affigens TaxID=2021234 RepID=A0A2P1PW93_9GAMM|nr:hypothetical protein [Ahniella affigens]AVP99131.1 hypothetical protein C7S18_19015 [Ahniella affigens]